jgi:signal transduction histidine kinase
VISKKFQKILLNFLIFFLVIGAFSLFIGHRVLNSNFEILLKQYQTTLANQIFKTIEQDVIVNNYRAAKQKLNTNFSQNDLSLITVNRDKRYSKTIYLGNIKDSDLYQIIKIPLYYDDKKENKWGDVEFHFNDSSLSESKSFLNIFFVSNQSLTLIFVTIIFYFIFKNFTGSFRKYNNEALKIVNDPAAYKEDGENILNDEVLRNLHNLAIEVNNKNKELRKKAKQEEAVKVSRQLAHDIRSPLSALDSISDKVSFPGESQLDIFNKSLQRVRDIAQNLLNVKESQSNLLENAQSVIEEIIKEKISSTNIHFDFSSQPINLLVNSYEYKRIISNILNNSIEANCSRISISLLEDENNYYIDILDNGDGISSDLLKKLNNGQQVDSTKKGGHGLGTSHANEFLTSNNANIFYSSELGKETNVRISINKNRKYVHLEDDPLATMVWKAAAKKAQIELLSFDSYQKLKEQIEFINKDALFYVDFDLLNDEIDGVEVCKELYGKGYYNLYLSTGHDSSEFSNLDILKGVIGKECPF